MKVRTKAEPGAGMSMNIAWVLFVIGIVMAIVLFVMGRRPKL